MNKLLYFIPALVLLVFFQSCSEDHSSKGSRSSSSSEDLGVVKDLFELMPASKTGLDFSNNIKDTMQLLCFSFEYSFNGGGVAVGDINNDGLQDLFFTSTLEHNKLYLNKGDWKFEDITSSSGVNNGFGMNIGTSMIDINNDGYLDIYVCKSGAMTAPEQRRNCLYINQGNLTFQEEAKAYGLDDPSFATQTYFTDFDLDGDLDAYCVNHPINWGNENKLNLNQDRDGNLTMIQDTQRHHITDRYLRNDNGKFVDKTYEFGVDNAAFGLSAAINDFNEDGYPDIYICNDYTKADQLMINQRGKGFKDEIEKYFDNITNSSMGSDVMDLNNDGKIDLFVNDMMPKEVELMKQQRSYKNYDLAVMGKKFGYHDQFKYNAMQLKMDDGLYSNTSYLTSTDKSGWSWAVLGEDYDHNGHTDLFIVNGYLKDVSNMDYAKFKLDSLRRIPAKTVRAMYDNWKTVVDSIYIQNYFFANKGSLEFVDASKAWNAGPKSYSNGAAFADLDNDGDLDLIVNNINDNAFLMRNNLDKKSSSKSLRVKLQSKNTNYGSTLTASYADGSVKTKYYYPIRGFVSSMEQIVHFAIPECTSISSLMVQWPDRSVERYMVDSLSGVQMIAKNKGQKASLERETAAPIFDAKSIDYTHKENDYIDFKREPLLHFKNSVEGPAVASGDLNGDNVDDLVVGGAFEQATTILIGNKTSYKSFSSTAFEESKQYEDVAIELGDIDKDGDLDILALAGGYQWKAGATQYGIKVFTNDGKANFTLDASYGPRSNNTSLALLDFDGDEDLDVFVGAGPIPGAYPNSDYSFILENEGGKFRNNTKVLPYEGKLGVIKSAAATDINADGKVDLVIGGEWTTIQVLINGDNGFTDQTKSYGLSETNGLWQSIHLADVDEDGDMDILAGNLGLNSFFKASADKPTCVYAYDFDGNGENDPIMCTYFGEKSYPVHSRDEILEQMTSLRKKYLRYKTFAHDDIEAMFGDKKISKAKIYQANTFATTLYINEGASFSSQALPNDIQVSMVKDMEMFDVDGDGTKEIVAVGNYWDTDFDFGKYDASVGTILKRNADGSYRAMHQTGFLANLNARSLNILDSNKFVVGNNNGAMQLFSIK